MNVLVSKVKEKILRVTQASQWYLVDASSRQIGDKTYGKRSGKWFISQKRGKKVMLMTMMMTLFAASAAIGMWGDGDGK